MKTREYLISLLEQLTVKQYKQYGHWFLSHIDRLVNDYPFINIGSKIKVDIEGEIVCEVKDFIILISLEGSGILVDTGYGNVFYYETKDIDK
jgi:hypothetical protein